MSSARTEDVLHGPSTWFDYDRSWPFGRQILLSECHASVLSNFVAMMLTLTGPRLWILMKASMLWVTKYIKRRSYTPRRQDDYQLPLVAPPVLSARSPQNSELPPYEPTLDHEHNENMVTTENSHSELGAALGLMGNIWRKLKRRHIELSIEPATAARQWPGFPWIHQIWKNFLQQPAEIVLSFLISAIFVGIFVAQSSGSVLSARLVSDEIALSSSPACYGGPSMPKGRGGFGGYSDYSEKCYHTHLGADGCTLFYNQSISYTEEADEQCPFSRSRCTEGIHAPFTLDTGPIDIKYLGINSAQRYQFRRRATCTPIVLDEDLLSRLGFKDSSSIPSGIQNDYVGESLSSLDQLFGLKNGMNYSKGYMTHVTTKDTIYVEKRDDPIFPAPYRDPGSNSSQFTNNGTSRGVIVCLDNSVLCDPRGNCRDFPPLAPWQYPWEDSDAKITEDELTRALVSRALASSSIYGGAYYTPFEVESHCRRIVCEHLPPAQWKVEARHWFERSLASLQKSVYDTVRGQYDAYMVEPYVPPNYTGMCRMVKFRSVGWRNVSFWGLFGLLALTGSISLASVKTEEELWVCVGVRLLYYALRRLVEQVKNISWSKT